MSIADHYKSLTENEFLGGWDLPEKGAVVIIETVNRFAPVRRKKKKNERTGQLEEERATKLDISFRGQPKHFLANRTCQKTIADLYGPLVPNWIGKPIHIYFDPSVEFGRKVVGGIRVSPRIPQRGAQATEQKLDQPVDVERQKAIEEARAAADGPPNADDRRTVTS